MLRRHGGGSAHVHPVLFRQRQVGFQAFDSVHQLAAERGRRAHQEEEDEVGEHDAADGDIDRPVIAAIQLRDQRHDDRRDDRQRHDAENAEDDDRHDLGADRRAGTQATAEFHGEKAEEDGEEDRHDQEAEQVRLHVAETDQRYKRDNAEKDAAEDIADVRLVIFAAMFLLDRLAESAAGGLNFFAVFLIDDKRAAAVIDIFQDRCLAGRHRLSVVRAPASTLADPLQSNGILQVFQHEITFDGEIERACGKRRPAAAGKTLVVDIVDKCRRQAFRRIPARNHDATRRIPPDLAPEPDVIEKNDAEPAKTDQCIQIVAQPPGFFLGGGRRRDDAFRDTDDNGQAFLFTERPRRCEDGGIATVLHAGVFRFRTERTREGRRLRDIGALRQSDAGRSGGDPELPAGAGDIPIKFVVIREETDLAVAAIGQDIGVLAAVKKDIFGAGIDANAARHALCVIGFRLTVASD